MATPPAMTAPDTSNLDKCISPARRMNPRAAKNTSLPFSSINLTRPATEQSLPETCPSLYPPPRHNPPHAPTPPLLRLISENAALPYCSGTNTTVEKENRGDVREETHEVHEWELTRFSWSGCRRPRRQESTGKVRDLRSQEKWSHFWHYCMPRDKRDVPFSFWRLLLPVLFSSDCSQWWRRGRQPKPGAITRHAD